MTTHINLNGRIECSNIEFQSGGLIEVLIDHQWLTTRIEHDGQQYYSTDGYALIGNPIRYLKNHSMCYTN